MRLILTTLAVMASFFASAIALGAEAGAEHSIEFVGYLIDAWQSLGTIGRIVGVLWALVPVFSLIVSLTPTPKDDQIWSAVYRLVEKLALVFFKAKQ